MLTSFLSVKRHAHMVIILNLNLTLSFTQYEELGHKNVAKKQDCKNSIFSVSGTATAGNDQGKGFPTFCWKVFISAKIWLK